MKISRLWILAALCLPTLGSAQTGTNWTPATRAERIAVSAESPARFEAVAQNLRSGLFLWCPAESNRGSVAWDYSTNATPYDLTNSAAAQVPVWVTNAGGAWQFDNTNYWTSGAAPSSLSTQGTYAIWMCMTQGGGNVQFLLNSSDNNGIGKHAWTLRVSASNTASFVTGNDTVNTPIESARVFGTNEWTHFAATHSNGNQRIFVNGVQVLAVSNTTWGSRGWTNALVGGGAPTANQRYFRGFLDNPQIWTRPLSSNEIFQLVWGPTNFGQRRMHNK